MSSSERRGKRAEREERRGKRAERDERRETGGERRDGPRMVRHRVEWIHSEAGSMARCKVRSDKCEVGSEK